MTIFYFALFLNSLPQSNYQIMSHKVKGFSALSSLGSEMEKAAMTFYKRRMNVVSYFALFNVNKCFFSFLYLSYVRCKHAKHWWWWSKLLSWTDFSLVTAFVRPLKCSGSLILRFCFFVCQRPTSFLSLYYVFLWKCMVVLAVKELYAIASHEKLPRFKFKWKSKKIAWNIFIIKY